MDIFTPAQTLLNSPLAAADLGLKYYLNTMLTLGDFHFSVDEVAYQNIQRASSWRWAEQQRFGQSDLLQYTGKGAMQISFDGEVYTDRQRPALRADRLYIGTKPLKTLGVLGDSAEPLLMVSGTGEIMGYWVVTGFNDSADRFLMAGIPRHQKFNMTIKYYGDDLYNP